MLEVFPFLPPSIAEQYRQVFESARPMVTEERNIVSGKEYVTETRKIPVLDGGQVVRVVTVVRDVTEIYTAQDRLRQAEKMEALGQLAGGIAHASTTTWPPCSAAPSCWGAASTIPSCASSPT